MNTKQFALSVGKFLARTSMAPGERAEFTAIEAVLNSMARDELVIGKPEAEKSDAEPLV